MKIAAAARRFSCHAPWLALLVPALCAVSACSRDTSDAGPRAAAAVAAIALGSDEYKVQRAAAPLPVELDYRLPANLAAGQPATLRFTVKTALTRGVLEFSVIEPVGLSIAGATRWQVELATSPRPLALEFEIVPAAQAQRSLTIAIAAQPGTEGLPRSFRIDLPAAAAGSD